LFFLSVLGTWFLVPSIPIHSTSVSCYPFVHAPPPRPMRFPFYPSSHTLA
jgi:hypothetical protein